jgi:hypothetical protein
VRFKIFKKVKIQVKVFWDVVVGYKLYGGPSCFRLQIHHPEDGGSKVLRNVEILPQHCRASHPRRHQLESFLAFRSVLSVNKARILDK